MTSKDHGPRLGADPELFVQDLDGNTVPVCGKIGGTKETPLIINHLIEAQYGIEGGRRNREGVDKSGNYAIQEDNVMLEFNIPAYKDGSYFHEAITKILTVLENTVLPQQGIRAKYEVMHTFKPEDIAPFPQAFTIGCLADMDAYSENGVYDPVTKTSVGFERPPFNAAHFGNHRFCGGHLHVQYNHNNVPRHIFAQFMDLVAELPFLRWDKQKMRRMFYGQPGLYREKPYGIEYRTTSNFWLFKPFRDKWLGQLTENIYLLARTANTNPEMLKGIYSRIDWAEVQNAIKSEDAKLADDLVDFVRGKLGMYMGPSATR
jgi:hypothetical protein